MAYSTGDPNQPGNGEGNEVRQLAPNWFSENFGDQ